MKVIFLDVDGVLNNYKTGGIYTITKSKVRLLRNIVEATGAKIVVSSTWRILHESRVILKRKLGYKGIKIFDWTRRSEMLEIRGNQIHSWLDNHKEVTNYIILDDDSDFLEYQYPFLVKTDPEIGLTKEDVEIAITLLNIGETK